MRASDMITFLRSTWLNVPNALLCRESVVVHLSINDDHIPTAQAREFRSSEAACTAERINGSRSPISAASVPRSCDGGCTMTRRPKLPPPTQRINASHTFCVGKVDRIRSTGTLPSYSFRSFYRPIWLHRKGTVLFGPARPTNEI